MAILNGRERAEKCGCDPSKHNNSLTCVCQMSTIKLTHYLKLYSFLTLLWVGFLGVRFEVFVGEMGWGKLLLLSLSKTCMQFPFNTKTVIIWLMSAFL